MSDDINREFWGKKRFRAVKEGEGPFLIWSMHWNAWHMRSSAGGAAGYTSDIAQAGIFEFKTANAYNDKPPSARDRAIPVAKAMKAMLYRLSQLRTDAGLYAARIAEVSGRAALAQEGK